MFDVVAASEDETRAFGRLLGEVLRPGDVVGLSGSLGAGKTVLVRGIAEGLGCDPEIVRSPSFTLMVTYRGGRVPLHHLDLYRMQPTEEDRLALREVLYGDAACAIEWFERYGEEIDHLRVEIEILAHGASSAAAARRSEDDASNARRIRIAAGGGRFVPLIEAVRSRWPS